jgi:Paraquat-inducible protein A
MTLGLWFASPSTVSVSRRGSVLLWLDFFAKWSIIDVFVLIVTIVTFRVAIKSPKLSYLPEDFYSIDLLVVPKWGLYANMLAQIISQLSSHVIIHYHRRIVEKSMLRQKAGKQIQRMGTADDTSDETPPLEQDSLARLESERPEVLSQHAFYRPHRGETDRVVVKEFVNPVLVAFFLCTCGLVIAGCFVPSYSLDILGLVGILIESGQDFQAAKTEFSVLSTLGVLFGQADLTGGFADYVGLGSLSTLLFLSVLLVPVLQLGALIVQWFMPLRPKQRRRLSIVLEILQAWQYAEVYLLSLLVGSWQLGPVSGT